VILIRRPCLVFDVDLIGAGGILVFIAAIGWLLIDPRLGNAQTIHDIHRELALSEPQRRDLVQELQATYEDIASLRKAVAAHEGQAPHSNAVPQFISEVMAVAAADRIKILTISPGQIQTQPEYLYCDILVDAEGGSVDFIAFLTALAARNPHQSLHSFSLTRAPGPGPGPCRLNCTLRLYMLPDAGQKPAAGEKPA
jgi:Tfp pilus assembly protein PilO